MTDRELLKEARDLIMMCSLLDKSNQCNEMANKIDKQLSIPLVSNSLPDYEEIFMNAQHMGEKEFEDWLYKRQ